MNALIAMRTMRCWPLIVGWVMLPALSACATSATGATAATVQREEAPPPTPSLNPPAAAQPAAAEAPAPAPAAPEAPVGALAPAAPKSEPVLPPCIPVSRPAHVAKKHKRTPRKPPQESAAPAAEPAQTPPDQILEARVGALDAPLTSILGKDVKSPKAQDLGRVVDVLADAEGHVRVAIIDFGGFLGVGTRRIAVDWRLLHFYPGADKSPVLSLNRQQLQSAPEYKDSKSPRVLMPPAAPDATDPGQTKH